MIDVVCVLDRSGSMAPLAKEVIGSFNSFVEEQQKEEGEARLTLVLFDDRYEIVHDAVPLQDVPELTDKVYFTRGMTALHDSIGKTITTLGDKKKVIVVIQTDGQENASQEYKKSAIKELVEQRTKDGWEFQFIGANIDAMSEGINLGIFNNTQISSDIKGLFAANAVRNTSVSSYRATN